MSVEVLPPHRLSLDISSLFTLRPQPGFHHLFQRDKHWWCTIKAKTALHLFYIVPFSMLQPPSSAAPFSEPSSASSASAISAALQQNSLRVFWLGLWLTAHQSDEAQPLKAPAIPVDHDGWKHFLSLWRGNKLPSKHACNQAANKHTRIARQECSHS